MFFRSRCDFMGQGQLCRGNSITITVTDVNGNSSSTATRKALPGAAIWWGLRLIKNTCRSTDGKSAINRDLVFSNRPGPGQMPVADRDVETP